MMNRVHAPALSHPRPPRTPSCSCCGTRSPCYAAPIPGPARLGRPRGPHRADPAPATTAADTPAGYPGHRPALAQPPGNPQVDLSAPDGAAAGQRRDHRPDRTARHREQRLRIPANPRRTAQTRPPGQRVHHPPGPQDVEDPACTTTAQRHDVAEVPAHPGCDDARHGFLALDCAVTLQRLYCLSSWRSARVTCISRCHCQPGRTVDHPADPQPADESRRSRREIPVPGP
jgi:hypothetical protein